MRTVKDIAELALDYLDVDEDNDGELLDDATVRQKKALASCITGALQELFAKKPEAFRVRSGATLEPPATGTIVATAGSTTVDASSWGSEDLRGRIFREGATWNQFGPAAAAPGNTIIVPWQGASGTRTVTVYDDAVLVPSWLTIGNVHLDGYGFLRPCPDRATYSAFRDDLILEDYGTPPAKSSMNPTGIPMSWWVEAAWTAAGVPQKFLRFAPLPDRRVTVSFDLALQPRELTASDLESTSLVLPVVAEFYDAVLVPWVLQRWTGCPWWKNAEARPEIARQFEAAQSILSDWGSGQAEENRQVIVAIL